MPTIADRDTLNGLVERLRLLRSDSPRLWGTLTAGEMLCHLGDAHESVLGIRIPPNSPRPGPPRPVLKWMALHSPIPWPKGAQTRPGVDPRLYGTRPGEFEQDRQRTIASLERLAAADPSSLAAGHFRFGPMSTSDWHRWAYRHVAHHLRQFGV
jgi:hypothetical protein